MCPQDSFEEDYYQKNYSNYLLQNPPKKLQFYHMLVKQAVNKIQQPRILEIGCAFGRFLSILEPGWHRYGIDVSKYAIGKARKSVSNAQLLVSSITEIPFKEVFDVIVAFDILEHVADLELAAHSVKSKLRPGGYFIFVVPVYDGPTGPLIKILDKDTTHINKRERNFWISWTALNFKLDQWWGIYRYYFPWGFYMHIPTKIFRCFTPAILVVARQTGRENTSS